MRSVGLRASGGRRDAQASLIAALAAAGFGPHALFNDAGTGTQGFGAVRADGKAVLAFRGTQSDDFHDLLTDVEAASVPWPEAGGDVHDGFAAGMRSVLADVETWVRGLPGSSSRLIVCGHSLGAALATLAASIFHPGTLITIGSPRVGDAEFVKSLGPTSVVRIVDCCDLVTHLPPESPDYTHVGNLWYIDRLGVASRAPDESMASADQIRARLDYGLTGLRSNMAPSRDLADHAPINYCRAFF